MKFSETLKETIMQRREYIDGPHGQIHLRLWGSSEPLKPTLLCLPPSPFSGIAFDTIAPLLAEHYYVIAMDYPGFGQSKSLDCPPSIKDFSDAAISVINSPYVTSTVDVFGFHTGCLVAVESSLAIPDRLNRLFLMDVAYFNSERQLELKSKELAKLIVSPSLSTLENAWEYTVKNRLSNTDLMRAYTLFVDQISAGETGNAAYNAAFSYNCEKQFSKVKTPTTIIATKAGLFDESCAAAAVILNSKLIKVPDVNVSVLEQAAPKAAKSILDNC